MIAIILACLLLPFVSANEFSPKRAHTVPFGRRVITEQPLVVSAAVFFDAEELAEHGTSFIETVSKQLSNVGYLLNSPALRERGYLIDFRVNYVAKTPAFSMQDLDRCIDFERFAFENNIPANLFIMAAYQLKQSPNGFLRGGVSNGMHCLMYNVKLDHCGLVLLHEALHSVFEAYHTTRVYGECYRKRFNVMQELYDRVCPEIDIDHMMTGLECDMLRDFNQSIYNKHNFMARFGRHANTDTNAVRLTNMNKSVVQNFMREHNTNPFLSRFYPLTDSGHINLFNRFIKPDSLYVNDKRTCRLSEWARPELVSKPDAPYRVYRRTRKCVCTNYFDKCDHRFPLYEYDIKMNSALRNNFDGFDEAKSPKKRDNCTTTNMCTYYCGKINYERIIVPHGSPCSFEGAEGVCVEGACMLLDNLPPVESYNVYGPRLSDMVNNSTNTILDCDIINVNIASSQLDGLRFLFNNTSFATRYVNYPLAYDSRTRTVSASGQKFCERLVEYLQLNELVTRNSIIRARVTRGTIVVPTYNYVDNYATCALKPSNSDIKLNSFTCDKYITTSTPDEEYEQQTPFTD